MPKVIQIDLDPKKIAADKRKIKKSMQKNYSPTYFVSSLTQKAIDAATLYDPTKDTFSFSHVANSDKTININQKSHIRDTFNDGKLKSEIWTIRTDIFPEFYNASKPERAQASDILPAPTQDYFITTFSVGTEIFYLKPVCIDYSKTYNIISGTYNYHLNVFYRLIKTNTKGEILKVVDMSDSEFNSMLRGNTRLSSDKKAFTQAFTDYLKSYSITEWLKYEAYIWQNCLNKHYKTLWSTLDDADINLALRYIGNKNVDLDDYKAIHNDLKNLNRWTPLELERLCRDNINIQMVHILDNMRSEIDQFPVTPAAPANYIATALDGSTLSSEQSSAVCSTEPLLLITAGAGTGKTQVITARAKFLLDMGVKPEDILILSFTRTAASTVETRLPGIKSLTINAFVDEIYKNNYPDQAIDNVMTFINTLKTLRNECVNDLAKSEFYKEFAQVMTLIYDNVRDAYAKLQTFVTEHFDEVMDTCKTIGRTTFDIQMVTACINIHNMTEPESTKAKYMFIDEVQDNSIFDFIFAIKYCEKHHIALTIVGDASQTLFEFRGADTKAIGVLERSDVFSKERLSINYRSNNEILAMANMQLGWIEANKTSNIKLISDQCAKPTTASFTNTVKLSYENVAYGGDKAMRELIWSDNQSGWLVDDLKAYVDDCLAKGEKVAFLAFQRRPLEAMNKALAEAYPDKTITNLTPPTPYDCNILSYFAANCDIAGAPYNNVLATLRTAIERSSAKMRKAVEDTRNGIYSPQMNVFNTVWSRFLGTYAAEVQNWVNDVTAGVIDDDQFDKNIRSALLDTETEYNSELNRQKLSNDPNKERAKMKADADILLSTIHSAKGDEFDNCVVLYHDESQMSEENKRMYYVAFTRAQHSLFISAYGSDKNPLIEAQYQETARNLV